MELDGALQFLYGGYLTERSNLAVKESYDLRRANARELSEFETFVTEFARNGIVTILLLWIMICYMSSVFLFL